MEKVMKLTEPSYADHLRFVIRSNVSFVRKFDAIYESLSQNGKINLPVILCNNCLQITKISSCFMMGDKLRDSM